jgi:SAM-dependent methyltransferase
MAFKDNFSKQADLYAQYRPNYPAELIDYVLSLSEEHILAWDCATGNGQVAVELTKKFNQVRATDASQKQIEKAFSDPKITYQVAQAQNSGLQEQSCDLITVAQAIHWFPFAEFYEEVKRVIKPGGVLAIWGYGLLKIEPSIDLIISQLYYNILGDKYWDAERKHLDNEYKTIPFPFPKMDTPHFVIQKNWHLADLIGYLNTWSSVQKYIQENQSNPIDLIINELKNKWQDENSLKPIVWDIYLLVSKF